MSEDGKLTWFKKQEDEANLGHVNLAQETGDDNSVAEHDGKELPVPVLKQEEIEGEILENDEQNSEEWWNYVQALVKNEENDNNGNLPTRYYASLCFCVEPCVH
jgi:hypothetical protein